MENLTDPIVGRTLDGRYHVTQRLARGGMATVYLATDKRLDRQVAVKIMHPHLGEDEAFRSRFHREARTVAKITHPRVVGVFDQGTDGDITYLAMEYVCGTTLRDVISKNAPLNLQDTLTTCEQILDALSAAHEMGLVHRDIKPENVLVSTNGQIKVADFGLARAVVATRSGGTSSSSMMGTIAYVAPEIVNEQGADARSDVYAVGVVLYEMLTGRQPFVGESAIVVARKHLDEDFPLPSESVPDVPQAIDELVLWATAKDPADRPVNAQEMLAELQDIRRELDPAALSTLGSASALSAAVTPSSADMPTAANQHVSNPTMALPADRTSHIDHMAPIHDDPEPVYAPDDDGYRNRPGRTTMMVISGALIAALVAGILVWYNMLGPGAYTTTPNVNAKPQEEASQSLRRDGFNVTYVKDWDDNTEVGHVIRTDPAAGDHIRKGGHVDIIVSMGSSQVQAPDVVGQQQAEAERLLGEVNLELGDITMEYNPEIDEGAVISQSILGGSTTKRGEKVNLVISRGPQPVDVPDVTESEEAAATQQLEALGLKVKVQYSYDETINKGFVISQSPGPGRGKQGQTVVLTVSAGSENQEFQLPNLTNNNVEVVKDRLEEMGLRVRVQRSPFGSDNVAHTQPRPGSMVRPGDTITLWVF